MPQLHFSVDDRTAQELSERAAARGESLSGYLAALVRDALPQAWPDGYLDSVVGSCSTAPLEEPADLAIDEVDLD